MSELWEGFSAGVESINNNPMFMGIMILLLNIGSKYIALELSKTQEQIISSEIMRKVLIFALAFTATKDVIKAFILTAVFTTLVSGLFHEKSSVCILPEHMRSKDDTAADLDAVPSEAELAKARAIIERYEAHRDKQTSQQIRLQNALSGLL